VSARAITKQLVAQLFANSDYVSFGYLNVAPASNLRIVAKHYSSVIIK